MDRAAGFRRNGGCLMSQTKKQSAFESVTNVVVGYSVNFTANALLFPIFGWPISVRQNLVLGIFYTVISLIRSYALRRFFNWRHSE